MSFSRLTRVAGVVAAGALAAGVFAASSLASASHAKHWQNPTHNVDCGIMFHGAAPAKEVLCSSSKIPAPPHSNPNDGDPGFVQLARHGKPKLLRLSQDSFASDHIVTLKKGTTWSSLGVTCKIAAKTVTCKNADGRGFEIAGPGGYKSIAPAATGY